MAAERRMTPTPPSSSTDGIVTVQQRNRHAILRFDSNNIGAREAAIIAEEACKAIDATPRGKCVVIDLSRCQSLSSMALGLCVTIANRSVEGGLRPVVAGMNVQLAELFRLMRVDRLFTTASSSADLERMLL
jgi:anti-anti-sigma regulatory factor